MGVRMFKKNKNLVYLFGTVLATVSLVGCGASDSSFSEALGQSTSASVDITDTEEVYLESHASTVAVDKIKIGQTCDFSGYSSNSVADLRNATTNIEIRIHKNQFIAFQDPIQRTSIMSFLQVNNNSLISHDRQRSRNMISAAIRTDFKETPECVIKYPALLSDIKKGVLPLKQLINQYCSGISSYKMGDDATGSDQIKIMRALEEVMQSQDASLSVAQEEVLDQMMPYLFSIVDGNASHGYFKIGITRDTTDQLFPVLRKDYFERANAHWEGYLSFLRTSADDKRCDYQRIAGS